MSIGLKLLFAFVVVALFSALVGGIGIPMPSGPLPKKGNGAAADASGFANF